jgi:hypothetical protein
VRRCRCRAGGGGVPTCVPRREVGVGNEVAFGILFTSVDDVVGDGHCVEDSVVAVVVGAQLGGAVEVGTGSGWW